MTSVETNIQILRRYFKYHKTVYRNSIYFNHKKCSIYKKPYLLLHSMSVACFTCFLTFNILKFLSSIALNNLFYILYFISLSIYQHNIIYLKYTTATMTLEINYNKELLLLVVAFFIASRVSWAFYFFYSNSCMHLIFTRQHPC